MASTWLLLEHVPVKVTSAPTLYWFVGIGKLVNKKAFLVWGCSTYEKEGACSKEGVKSNHHYSKFLFSLGLVALENVK